MYQFNGVESNGRASSGWEQIGPLEPQVWQILNPGYLCYYYEPYNTATAQSTTTSRIGLFRRGLPPTPSVPISSGGFSLAPRSLPTVRSPFISILADTKALLHGSVSSTPSSAFQVSSTDRTHLTFLRSLDPAPVWQITMNNIDVSTFRAAEAALASWTVASNRAAGVATAAIWNQPHLLNKLVLNTSIPSFVVDSGSATNVRVTIANPVTSSSSGNGTSGFTPSSVGDINSGNATVVSSALQATVQSLLQGNNSQALQSLNQTKTSPSSPVL